MKTLRRFSRNRYFSHARITAAVIRMLPAVAMLFISVSPPASAQPTARTHPLTPKFSAAVAFDVSPPLRNLALAKQPQAAPSGQEAEFREVRPEREPRIPSKDKGYSA